MNKKNQLFTNIAKFIVDKRKLFYLVFLCFFIFCLASISKVKINYDIASYLPDETETKQSLDIMENEFTTFGTAQIMVSNVTLDEATELYNMIEQLDIEGVKSVEFVDDEKHYLNSNALFIVTLADADGSDKASAAIEEIRDSLKGYDVNILAAQNSNAYADSLKKDILNIMVIVAIVIGIILVLSSKSYMEVPIFIIIFLVAAVLNMGTNYWFGQISFVSNTVGTILQLALAIDYAIILAHRFIEEKEKNLTTEEAVIAALSKAIPEITASSLTTVAGLVAMMFMQLKLGLDLGLVLTKGIICSLITVFILMPGLLVLFDKPLEKTKHKNFIPKINGASKIIVAGRYIMPVIFLVLILGGAVLSTKNEYAFSQGSITSMHKLDNAVQREAVEEVFGKSNTMAIIVPSGDYNRERELLSKITEMEKVTSGIGLASVEFKDGLYITDNLTIKQFSDALDMDRNTVQSLYVAYALINEEYNVIRIDDYSVSLLSMVDFMRAQMETGVIKLSDERQKAFDDIYTQLTDARLQLEGETYSRMVFNVSVANEGAETYALLDEIRALAATYYDGALLVGDSTSSYDLYDTFTADNLKMSLLTILFVLIILLGTFSSIGAPILLVLIIQGSIWINFAIPAITGSNIFFFSYLVVSAIQMGATIDYAIVISNRFQELKETMRPTAAAKAAIVQCFPTIITSSSIMTICGLLIGFMVTDPIVSSIGLALGRGTIISLLSVLIVLPETLILFNKIIDKTVFRIDLKKQLGIDFAEVFRNSAFQISFNPNRNRQDTVEEKKKIKTDTKKESAKLREAENEGK